MKKFKHVMNNKRLPIIVTVITLIIAIVCAHYWLRSSITNPLSEDAIVNADLVNISSSVPGRITHIYVTDNSKVKRGDLLFTIEKTPYQIRLAQTKVALAIAESALNTKLKNITAEQLNSDITDQQILRAKTNLDLATETLKRLEPLQTQGYVTKQQIDDARTAKHDAEISYQQAISQANAAKALINDADAEIAFVELKRNDVAFAQWELDNTDITAPNDGFVTGLNTSAGKFVISGQSIFTLVNSENWFVSAYFRETTLKNIKLNSCVKVYVMADKSKLIKGYVNSIGWGVISTELLSIPSQLPYLPKSLNWVHVEQRFPVRISLVNPPEELMRVGASAITIIQHDDCSSN
ncbi:multidrug transporter subunit MdtN [Orbus sturtevantii]|uniref:multidrug transporter subunit MdtN n=1 Tax=Orbus sturtevantii TaxID=3074109 RepID=UPI00370D7243